MKNFKNNPIIKYLILLIIIFDLFIMNAVFNFNEKYQVIQIAIVMSIIGCIVFAVISLCKKKSAALPIVCTMITVIGIILRIGYMLYTPCNQRSHDLGKLDLFGYGHGAYILTLLYSHALPTNNTNQFYQQPLFYFLSSLFSELTYLITRINNNFLMTDAAKCVSCFSSCAMLMLTSTFCKEFELEDKGRATAIGIVAFVPAMMLTGGAVAPDALAGLFITLEVLFTVRWSKKPSMANTIILAICYGLGICTKISCGVPALITLIVFIVVLGKEFKTKRGPAMLGKLGLFALISFPLGLWYNIRNLILFGQSLGYVVQISKTSKLYTGDYSIFSRLFAIDLQNYFATPYSNTWEDYNVPVLHLKSALFGEFVYPIESWIPISMLFLSTLILGLLLYSIVRLMMKERKNVQLWLLLSFLLLFYVSILIFCLRYPFGCSSDFRYNLFTIIPIAVLTGKNYTSMSQTYRNALISAMSGFAVVTILFFVLI